MGSAEPAGEDERRIAQAFNEYFATFGIRLDPDDMVPGSRRTIRDPSGWAITFRVDHDADGRPVLEFYATHRRTNDRHVRIDADGNGEHLEALSEIMFVSSDEAAEVFDDRNEVIARHLQERGLYPHGM